MTGQITPCLWFDNCAEEAASFYVSLFRNNPACKGVSGLKTVSRYGKEGFEIHGQKEGTAMTVNFILNDQHYTALNGGPLFPHSEAISFQIFCDDQQEVDYFWDQLTKEGTAGQCGWLKDKFGLSWQIIPTVLPKLLSNPDMAGRVTNAFLSMKKLDISKLLEA
jgi:predicted 3-demethylubiquinone-9 3-methyltransferase (glyoxalase superfamily)